MALNAKLKRDGGSEFQTKNMALKAKPRKDGGFECQTEKNGSEGQTEKI